MNITFRPRKCTKKHEAMILDDGWFTIEAYASRAVQETEVHEITYMGKIYRYLGRKVK